MRPIVTLVGVDDFFSTSIQINSGDQNVAAYGLSISYPAEKLDVLFVDAGSSGLTPISNLKY